MSPDMGELGAEVVMFKAESPEAGVNLALGVIRPFRALNSFDISFPYIHEVIMEDYTVISVLLIFMVAEVALPMVTSN